jgi:hypothetical protein
MYVVWYKRVDVPSVWYCLSKFNGDFEIDIAGNCVEMYQSLYSYLQFLLSSRKYLKRRIKHMSGDPTRPITIYSALEVK